MKPDIQNRRNEIQKPTTPGAFLLQHEDLTVAKGMNEDEAAQAFVEGKLQFSSDRSDTLETIIKECKAVKKDKDKSVLKDEPLISTLLEVAKGLRIVVSPKKARF